MPFDQNKSLEELECEMPTEPVFISSLVERVHKLYRKPLSTFTVEDLRLMINQDIGLPFLMPLALEKLEMDPFIGGDYYSGDLLMAVLGVRNNFWRENDQLFWRVHELACGLSETVLELHTAIEKFISDRD